MHEKQIVRRPIKLIDIFDSSQYNAKFQINCMKSISNSNINQFLYNTISYTNHVNLHFTYHYKQAINTPIMPNESTKYYFTIKLDENTIPTLSIFIFLLNLNKQSYSPFNFKLNQSFLILPYRPSSSLTGSHDLLYVIINQIS